MPSPLIGVDIGTTAVRAVELERTRSGPALRAFGQVGLPVGAVVDGEVADVAAVSEALRRLWREAGFSGRRVVLGVSGQRVIVRQAEVASMSEADFRSAVRFEAEQLIPLPVDDTELAFSILGPPEGGAGGSTMRIVLAAAHREVVAAHLQAASGADLMVEAVDVGALAMLRAVHGGPGAPPQGPDERDALVCVGANLTTVAVSEGRSAGFVRIISGGGATLTAAVAADGEEEWAVAEARKRATVGSATLTLERGAEPLVADIGQSIDFFLAQHPGVALRRVLVTGGGMLAAGCFEALAHQIESQADVADGFAGIDTSSFTEDLDSLRRASPFVLTATGLALWPLQPAGERLSLLPATVVRRRQLRRDARRSAIAVCGLAAVLLAAWGAQEHRVSAADQVAAGYSTAAASTQARVDALSPVNDFFAAVDGRIRVDRAALAGSVDWRGVIAQIAAAMPAGATLTGFQVSAPTAGPGAPTATSTSTANSSSHSSTSAGASSAVVSAADATVTMNVTATGGVDEVAAYLQAMGKVPSLDDAWVAGATAVPAGTGTPGQVTFVCTASVTAKAPVQHPNVGGQS
jgi:type IV pilus assembly protein PilM